MQYRRGHPSPWVVQIRNPITRERETYSFETEDEAEDFQYKRKREIKKAKRGLQIPVDESVLVCTAFDEYIEERKQDSLKTGEPAASTVYAEDTRSSHWRNIWARRTTASIQLMEVEKELRDLMHVHDRSVATRNRHLSLLTAFFTWCMKKRYADEDATAGISVIKEKTTLQVRPHGVWTDRQQVELYIATAYRFGKMWGTLATYLIVVGNRLGEATARLWGDIDWEIGSIRVNTQVSHRTGEILQRTKGYGDAAEGFPVAVPPRATDSLEEWRAASRFRADQDLIFFLDRGLPLGHKDVYAMHARIIKAAALPYITVHGLRHVCSYLMQESGASDSQRRDQLGQKTLRATTRYTHTDIRNHARGLRATGFGASQRGGDNVLEMRGRET